MCRGNLQYYLLGVLFFVRTVFCFLFPKPFSKARQTLIMITLCKLPVQRLWKPSPKMSTRLFIIIHLRPARPSLEDKSSGLFAMERRKETLSAVSVFLALWYSRGKNLLLIFLLVSLILESMNPFDTLRASVLYVWASELHQYDISRSHFHIV